MEDASDTAAEIDAVKGIHRLPPEILAKIFGLCAILPLQDHRRKPWSVKPLKWRAWQDVTRVCRRWHTVAFECTPLWATIYISSIPGQNAHINTFISRSETAPLTIIFDESPSYPRFDEGCKAVLTQLSISEATRMRELHIRCSDRTRAVIRSSVPTMAPYLHLLHIDSQSWKPTSIFMLMAKEQSPRYLKSMRLESVDCSHIAMCSNLRDLNIYTTSAPGQRSFVRSLLHAIGSLAHLRTLILSILLQNDDRNLPVVRLRSLKRLEIRTQCDEPALAELVACLHIPTDAAMKVYCHSTVTPLSICDILRNKLSTLSPDLAPSRLYFSQDEFCFYIRWNPRSFSRVEIPIEEPPLHFLCELSWICEDETVLTGLCHQLYFPGIRRLFVTVNESMAREIRKPLVTLYPDLEELHLGGQPKSASVVEDYLAPDDTPVRSLEDISLPALSADTGDAVPPTQDFWPFHRLRILSISCIIFDTCEGHGIEVDEDYSLRMACVHTFWNALESRITHGRCAPLERLVISRCYNFTEESLEYLRDVDIAADVSWDGVERKCVSVPDGSSEGSSSEIAYDLDPIDEW